MATPIRSLTTPLPSARPAAPSARPATHRFSEAGDALPQTIPVPRFPGMPWPGDDEVAHVPVALVLAARGRCSCDSCCEAFVHMVRRSQLRSV